jgi:beta-lactamase regulating signal transducer with metallopeptidase domain
MNSIGIALVWCAVQVTLIGLVAAGLYLLVRRFRPVAAMPIVLTALVMVVLLSLLAFSPWPRWATLVSPRSQAGEDQAATASDTSSQIPIPHPQSLLSSPTSPRPLAGEGPGVRAADIATPDAAPLANPQSLIPSPSSRPSLASHLWQTVADELFATDAAFSSPNAHWPTVVAVVLLVMMGVGLVWLLIGVVAVRWQRRQSRPVTDSAVLEMVDILCAELGCLRPVELRQSDDLATAATIGWRRPVVLLPGDWPSWTEAQRRAVLAHEIAHARSQDFLALLVGQLGLMLHFYHPVLHWLVNRLRLEQELAADAAAASISGGQRQYLATIAELALRTQDRPLLWPARSFLPTQTTFLRRIAMLRDTKLRFGRLSPFVRWTLVGLVLCCGLLVAGLRGPSGATLAQAAEPESQKKESPAVAKEPESPKEPTVAKEDAKPAEEAASSDVIDTSFFSEDASAIVVLRPAAAVAHPEAAKLAKFLETARKISIFDASFGEVRQVTMIYSSPEAAEPVINMVIQFVQPIAEAYTLKQPFVGVWDEKELDGKKLYVKGRAFLVFDKYTVVMTTSESAMQTYIEGKRGVLPKWWQTKTWESFNGDHWVLAIDSAFMQRTVKELLTRSQPLTPFIAAVSPLGDETDRIVIGAKLDEKLTVHALLSGKNDANSVTKLKSTVEALKVLLKNTVAGLTTSPANGQEANPWMLAVFNLAGDLLDSLQLKSEGNIVHLDAAVTVDWKRLSDIQPLLARADKATSINNMKQIALAMLVYESATKKLPPAYQADKEGKPLLSWRVLVLPYLNQTPLYKEFHLDEPWDSEHNKPLIAMMPDVFKSPKGHPGEGKTNYLTVRGKNTAFPGDKGCSIGDIKDGTSCTFALVEANDDSAAIWTKPDDFAYDEKDPMKGLIGLWPDGFLAALVDGSVHFMASTLDPTTLNHLFLRNDGCVIDREKVFPQPTAYPQPQIQPKPERKTPSKSADAIPQGTPAATGNAKEKKENAVAVETAATKGDAAPATPKTDNIVLNPSAEEGGAWLQGGEIPGVTYTWDKNVAFEGKASLCIKKTANRYFPVAEWGQTVKRTGDLPCLEVSAQVKAKRATKAVLDVVFLDKDGKPIKHQWVAYIGAKEISDKPVDHDWQKYSGKVAIPDGTVDISIVLQDYGPGTVWFDDIQARYANGPADDPEKLLSKKPTASVKPTTLTRPTADTAESAGDSAKSGSSDVIQEGVGWKDIRVGMSKKDLFQTLGNPEPPPASNAKVGIFCWSEKHIDCTFHQGAAGVSEIRFNEGFQGALANGLKLGSPSDGMMKLYGEPESTKTQDNGAKQYEYSQKGILFWTYQGKITQIVVFKPYKLDPPIDENTSTASGPSETIQEGIGLKDVKVGMTKEEVIKVMGPPDDDSKPNWLKWRKKHIECTFYEGATGVSELRIMPGFHGALANGIQIGSPGDQVVKQYGEPTEMRQENGGKFYAYQNHGVFFWTRNGKVTSITVVTVQGNAQPSTANPSSSEKSSAAPAGSVSGKDAASAEPPKEKPTSVTMNNRRYLVENQDSNAAAERPSSSSSATTELKYDDGKSDGQHSYADAGEMIQYALSAEKGRLQGIRVFGSRYGEAEPPDENFTISILNEDGSKVLFTEAAPYKLFERGEPRWVDIDFKNAREVPKTFWIALNFNALPTKGVYVHYDTSTGGKYSQIGLPGEECVDVDFGGDWMIRAKLADASANVQVIPDKPVKIVATKKNSSESEKEAEAARSADTAKNGLVLKYGDGKSDGQRSLGGSGEAIQFTLPTEKGQLKGIRLFGSRYGLPQPPKEDVLVYILNEDMSQVLHTETVPYKTFPRTKKPGWIDVNFKQAREVPKVFWVAIDFKAHETQGVYLHFDTSTEGKYSKAGLPGKEWKDVDFGGDWMIRAILGKTSEDQAKP